MRFSNGFVTTVVSVFILFGIMFLMTAGITLNSVSAGILAPSIRPVIHPYIFAFGFYRPSFTDYNFKHCPMDRFMFFLNSLDKSVYTNGTVVMIDGLKWKRQNDEWMPFPNRPEPSLEKNEDTGKHLREYGKWIESNPHLGYPPLPLEMKEIK